MDSSLHQSTDDIAVQSFIHYILYWSVKCMPKFKNEKQPINDSFESLL